MRTQAYYHVLTVGIVLLSAFVIVACRPTKEERYIVSQNEGTVVIAFSDKQGEPRVMDGLKHVYSVPRSGLLFTQEPLRYGPFIADYYIRDSSGRLSRLRYIWPEMWKRKFADSNEIVVWYRAPTKMLANGNEIHLLNFIVGPIRKADELTARNDSIVNSFEDTIVKRYGGSRHDGR